MLLLYTLLVGQATVTPVLADDMQPAYLDVEERPSGAIHVIWKVPSNQPVPDRFAPVFPESFKAVPPRATIPTSSAITESWTLISDAAGIGGARIGIAGLEETSMDALVRVQFKDGSVHRTILTPTAPFTTVPSSEPTDASPRRTGRFINNWPFALLFCAAWGLSFTRGARRRGIFLCAAALVAGGLCGHALGRLPIRELIPGKQPLTEPEAKRILTGLMLNTYRAFMLEDENEIYDVLARSVAGEFLSEIYLQNRGLLKMDPDETALSLVNRVDIKAIESIRPETGDAMSMVVNWDVYGLVYHWEHVHFRCNAYRAELTIAPMDGYWKITRLELLDGTRVI